jgi:hypothetical protein
MDLGLDTQRSPSRSETQLTYLSSQHLAAYFCLSVTVNYRIRFLCF